MHKSRNKDLSESKQCNVKYPASAVSFSSNVTTLKKINVKCIHKHEKLTNHLMLAELKTLNWLKFDEISF